MKLHWLQQRHSPRLILFFNGWGMDDAPFANLQIAPDEDVLMCCDYRSFAEQAEIAAILGAYREVGVIAWSMGVWAYAHCAPCFGDQIACALAVNGTCQPIHAHYGIPPQTYQATLDHFDEPNRMKFLQRMCGSPDVLRRFQAHPPQRPFAEQRAELAALQHLTADLPIPASPYRHALIGKHDRIILTPHQVNFWREQTPYTLFDAPHFPFFTWKSWRAILDYVTAY